MKIAFCIFKYFPFGGLQRDMMRIAKAFQKQNHQIIIYTMSWQGGIPEGFDVHEIKCKGLSNHAQATNFSTKVNKTLKEHPVDLVFGFNRIAGLDYYFSGDVCYQASKANHNKAYKLSKRYRTFVNLERAVFSEKSKTKIFVLTDQQKQDYQQCYQTPDDRFIQVPAGIEHRNVTPDNYNNLRKAARNKHNIDAKHVLVMVGSQFANKGVDRTLIALSKLPQELLNDTLLYVVGDDDAQPYLKQANKLNIDSHVIFTGGTNNVDDYLLAADYLIHPCLYESAGMVLLESLANGLPILTTQASGYAFHIEKAQAGVVLERLFSQDAFNQALFDIFNNTQHQQWHENALSYAKETDLYGLCECVVGVVE